MSLKIRNRLVVALSLLSCASVSAAPLGTLCPTLLHPRAEWIAAVEKDPVLSAHAKTIEKFLLTYKLTGKVDRPAAEKEVLTLLADLRDQNKLRTVLAKVVNEARKTKGFPPIPGDDASVAEMLYGMIDAELHARGLSPQGLKIAFKDWAKLTVEQLTAVVKSGKSAIGSQEFYDQFWALVSGQAHVGNQAVIVNDAQESLKQRIRMLENAKKSIWLTSWAMYGDNAGNLFADLLIKKFKEGVDVRIMVDGQTAQRIGYREAVAKLHDAGVPLIEWRSEVNPYYGQHRKFTIVDHEAGMGEAIAGGRNLGDDYLHTGTKPNSPKWRDTDILYQGPVVGANTRRFQLLWNEQCDRLKNADWKISDARANRKQQNFGSVKMGVIDHVPNAGGYDPIYLGLLKAIDSATKTIDIANAYVILTPAMQDAIIQARARGVRVRIFTNSATSIDEPIISAPILMSLAQLLPSGVEVYVKNGDTLHSKFANFDGLMSWVMSYNLHPRSLRYEGETANVIFDAPFSKAMLADYEKDLEGAKRINTVADLQIPASKAGSIVGPYFFDQY